MGARHVSGSLSFVFLLLIAGHATAETAVAPSPVATAVSSSTAYTTPGTYCVMLTVTDSRGRRASDTALVSVANRSLVANAGPDQTASVGSAVTFSGSGSDLGGTVVSYSWDFGDGTSATGATVSHIYTAPGRYTATLTVMDDRGARGIDSALVTFTGAAGAGW